MRSFTKLSAVDANSFIFAVATAVAAIIPVIARITPAIIPPTTPNAIPTGPRATATRPMSPLILVSKGPSFEKPLLRPPAALLPFSDIAPKRACATFVFVLSFSKLFDKRSVLFCMFLVASLPKLTDSFILFTPDPIFPSDPDNFEYIGILLSSGERDNPILPLPLTVFLAVSLSFLVFSSRVFTLVVDFTVVPFTCCICFRILSSFFEYLSSSSVFTPTPISIFPSSFTIYLPPLTAYQAAYLNGSGLQESNLLVFPRRSENLYLQCVVHPHLLILRESGAFLHLHPKQAGNFQEVCDY